MTSEKITLKAEIEAQTNRALDPQNHDVGVAREIAAKLCRALTDAYGSYDSVRPETLAVAVQTALETLLSGIEREGVDAASMRVAFANSILVNGDGVVSIEIGQDAARRADAEDDRDDEPAAFRDMSRTVH